MSATRIGRLLLALGVLVGVVASLGLLLGFEPARLPAALLNLAAYKLTFLAALAILAAGASFVRYGRGRAGAAPSAPTSPARVPGPELAAGGPGGGAAAGARVAPPDAADRQPTPSPGPTPNATRAPR